ncbi:hypothetical protein [Mycolicibacterium fallax]|uniref:Uncharacterized protein n=1 Tax=Mycolicibacterium fallax TaxID=1793 RepID=A0A1X1RK66_MYCFA|nr:hypothetical protein [Mycolicibacterium fallax]ORV08053.1 hypothetical protein AWC04_02625 [Mycolicibacterium fallax]
MEMRLEVGTSGTLMYFRIPSGTLKLLRTDLPIAVHNYLRAPRSAHTLTLSYSRIGQVRRKKKASEDPDAEASIAELARRRDLGRSALAHLRFIQENLVDHTVVHQGLALGLSQDELAARLGMSKREVNRHANSPALPAGSTDGAPFGELVAAFLAQAWAAP